jgi:hypothetical protein
VRFREEHYLAGVIRKGLAPLALSLVGLALLGGCVCKRHMPSVPHYPRLPARSQVPLGVHFDPAPGLVEVELTCGPAELLENGLDDDCDGRVDAEPEAGPYLALAHTSELGVVVEVRNAEGRTLSTVAAEAGCTAAPHLETSSLSLDAGQYELFARVHPGCPPGSPASLSISVGGAHSRHVYAVEGLSSELRSLGHVSVAAAP